MENTENNQEIKQPIIVDDKTKNYLSETIKWGNFLAIIGYVGIGLLALGGIALTVSFAFFYNSSIIEYFWIVAGFVYLVMAVVLYFPVTYLYKFCLQMKQGLQQNEQKPVTFAFENLKSLFKFVGIYVIVILCIYALLLLIVVLLSFMGISNFF